MGIGAALSIGLIGIRAFVIQIQTFISPGLPYFSIIGLPDTSLSEARERVKSACHACGFRWPATRVTVNMSPASMPKRGASHDLAIAASVLSAAGAIPHNALEGTVVIGEVNLDGTVLPVNGLLPIMLHARSRGIKRAVVPYANLEEASLIDGIAIAGVRHLGELIELAGGTADYRLPHDLSADERQNTNVMDHPVPGDMDEVIGQHATKKALEVAAAGGHHLLMVGPPGSGKTMLASRLPGIMSPLDEYQQLEVASIRSICGTLSQYGVSDIPPFEAPHHTASCPALVGGGHGLAQPGAISRAHCGVLFMDEAPEFSVRALQSLREPLESGYVVLSRFGGTVHYPARFQLVMAANPCPCGFDYGSGERCTCRERDRIRYFARLSGPILDRIDIQVEVPPVTRLSDHGITPQETSTTIRMRVTAARHAARQRFADQGWTCNAQASGTWLREHTPRTVLNIIDRALSCERLSLRGADRAMRLAWTLADLDGASSPHHNHILSAISLRARIRS